LEISLAILVRLRQLFEILPQLRLHPLQLVFQLFNLHLHRRDIHLGLFLEGIHIPGNIQVEIIFGNLLDRRHEAELVLDHTRLKLPRIELAIGLHDMAEILFP